SARPLVGIGLVSYGWYLWHWPLLVFSRIYLFYTQGFAADIWFGGIVGLALATLTYRMIEQPIARNKRPLAGQYRRRSIAVLVLGCLLALAPGIFYSRILAPRLAADLGVTHWPVRTDLTLKPDPCIIDRDGRLSTACQSGTPGQPLGL